MLNLQRHFSQTLKRNTGFILLIGLKNISSTFHGWFDGNNVEAVTFVEYLFRVFVKMFTHTKKIQNIKMRNVRDFHDSFIGEQKAKLVDY